MLFIPSHKVVYSSFIFIFTFIFVLHIAVNIVTCT